MFWSYRIRLKVVALNKNWGGGGKVSVSSSKEFPHMVLTIKVKLALNRPGTEQQRPESPTVKPPGIRVNTEYTNSNKGTSPNMWFIVTLLISNHRFCCCCFLKLLVCLVILYISDLVGDYRAGWSARYPFEVWKTDQARFIYYC